MPKIYRLSLITIDLLFLKNAKDLQVIIDNNRSFIPKQCLQRKHMFLSPSVKESICFYPRPSKKAYVFIPVRQRKHMFLSPSVKESICFYPRPSKKAYVFIPVRQLPNLIYASHKCVPRTKI